MREKHEITNKNIEVSNKLLLVVVVVGWKMWVGWGVVEMKMENVIHFYWHFHNDVSLVVH